MSADLGEHVYGQVIFSGEFLRSVSPAVAQVGDGYVEMLVGTGEVSPAGMYRMVAHNPDQDCWLAVLDDGFGGMVYGCAVPPWVPIR